MWSEELFEGDYTSNILIDATNLVATREFTVPETPTAWLNLTLTGAAGNEAHVRLVPPGCADSSCWVESDTQQGAQAFEVDDPEAGAWGLLLFPDPADTGTYEMRVNSVVPAPSDPTGTNRAFAAAA